MHAVLCSNDSMAQGVTNAFINAGFTPDNFPIYAMGGNEKAAALSAYGGTGKVGGVVIGAVFMGVLNMGMSLLGADINLQRVINGFVLLVAVTFDIASKKRKAAA